MNITKFISFVSFLFIGGLGQHGVPNVALILIILYQFVHDIFHFQNGMLWEGLMMIPLIGTLLVLLLCEEYKDRYLLICCYIALLVTTIFLTGVFNSDNYSMKVPNSFIIPLSVFLISSVVSVILIFKKPVIKK
ncbi:hypothetical protein M2347_000356 [Chryseobacterium sp. H1D6B]|uniref:hypothetical protein n=1 Tax=Chryseobacterium sp. H1D6B TaxID=2940588 RepID=UPI0015C74437|nr:hypothetical protein [Chryseobacterium sp. H1D6B]MDH6250629.1 hypothetical protein [Chryseobacterium sp. H1D6B]